MMPDFSWNVASLPALYVLTWNGMVRVDLTSLKCEEIKFAWEEFGGIRCLIYGQNKEMLLKGVFLQFSTQLNNWAFQKKDSNQYYHSLSLINCTFLSPPQR